MIGKIVRSVIERLFRPGGSGREAIENGVYLWEGNQYVKLSIDRVEDLLNRAGYYLLYFHNNLCPSCRRFYPLLESILRKIGGELARVLHIRIVCDWFTSRCTDSTAKKLFMEFNVVATPKLLFVRRDSGGSIHVISDVIEDLGLSISKEEDLLRALITLIKKNVSGMST